MRELTLDKLPGKVLGQLDLETVFIASRVVLAAEKLQIFRKLHGKELSAAAIGRRVGIHRKHCESFLNSLVFLGLMRKKDSLYYNTSLANKYFVQGRSANWTRFWSEYCIKDYEALTVMEAVMSSGRDWRQILGKERLTDYERVQEDPQWAREFTLALWDENKADADVLAKNLDLSGYQSLLDVGGGSGVMSIALTRAHPHLKACILDFKFVCDTAREIIRKERLSCRIKTLEGDMNQSLPRGYDVIMFWEIGHIDTRVMKMAYGSLSDGGMVVRNCIAPSRSRVPSPAIFIREYVSVMPKGETKHSIMRSLKEAGFSSVKHRWIRKDLGLITGHKK